MAFITDDKLVDHFAKLLTKDVKVQIFNNDNDFSIIHINIRSLNLKMGQLELFLADLNVNFSCIVISETWFNDITFTNCFAIAGYTLFCSSRSGGGGGGIAVYVDDQLGTRVADVKLAGSEALLVRIDRAGRGVCSLLAVYRAPSGGLPSFLGDLARCFAALPSNSIVVGEDVFRHT